MSSAQNRNQLAEKVELWPPIEGSLSLAEALAPLSKGDLTAIRSLLKLAGLSSLKKDDLAARLTELLPEHLPELLLWLDEETFQLVKKAAADGWLAENSPYGGTTYLFERGYLFRRSVKGKNRWIMPAEIADACKKLDLSAAREAAKRNARTIRLVRGLLNYYGVLSLEEMHRLLAPHLSAELSVRELKKLLEEAVQYGASLQAGDYGYADDAAVDPSQVRQEQQLRPDLTFREFSTDELMQAGEFDYIERNASYKAFVRFLETNYSLSEEDADGLIFECSMYIQEGARPSQMLEFFQEQLEMEDMLLVQGFIGHITELHNTTRFWGLKGHSPNELTQEKNGEETVGKTAAGNVVDLATGRKVGRNDPCPCGSGKKFKKCCGG
ncbi:YecA family protein [Cohnella sp. AR92]|uniref:YecA family protein n=1 Tax=Cohnella sp. AR92 TaxID=648716 RepID=UPI0013158B9B|nr:SEC-C metal-binding domain-containing protein [Cohnella sp. AR92]